MRLEVRKTYKLLIGGAAVRSESGRVVAVHGAGGELLANAPLGSRKDGRDAVRAARAALGSWSGRTAYNRGQILYRLAEVLEARTAELADVLAASTGASAADARAELATAVDAAVHYAGWTDKLGAVLGAVNPVAAPYFSFSAPEPIGVVVLLAPDAPALAGLIDPLCAALAGGNTVVAIVSGAHPLVGLDLAEVVQTSDVPAGVVNLLAGSHAEIAPHLASHGDVDALVDATSDPAAATALERACAANVTRYRHPGPATSLEAVERTLELKTAWHPIGS
jgi:acyl-CoA reductase-like NAD-dependent aldehyde dehydrogenase